MDWEEGEINVELTPIQRIIYDHLEQQRPSGGWLIQARKCLLDPRLVDPEVLRRAGVLGQVDINSSSKYKKLEELLVLDDGPVAKGEKFIIFSSMFREGVTQQEHKYLRERYYKLYQKGLYKKLQLNKTLDKILEESLKHKFGQDFKIAVIDGTILDIEERERIIDRLSQDDKLVGIICTTETGGESLDFTAANHVLFLDEDYSPKTTEQALSRVVRKGQDKKVSISYLRSERTIDEDVKNYVEAKRIITKIAMDGHSLTEKELELLEDTKGKRLIEMIKKRVGGTSIDIYEANIENLDDFESKKRISGTARNHMILMPQDYETTDAQRINQMIGQHPVECWFDPEFVELYMNTLKNLSVPVIHRAKIIDLIKRVKDKEISMPKNVISDGSGPSLLWEAYQSLSPLIKREGYKIPVITDRDISPLMLERGRNPNKILGNMNGQDSKFKEKTFNMVDNESITLLQSDEDVKRTLLESHRILKDEGLLELVVKNTKFSDSFYSAIEKLGFELISDKNIGFSISKKFLRRLKEIHGEHFAESYAAKLSKTYMLLAKKIDNPVEVKAKEFAFETIEVESKRKEDDNLIVTPVNIEHILIGDDKKKEVKQENVSQEKIVKEMEIKVDQQGIVQSVKNVKRRK